MEWGLNSIKFEKYIIDICSFQLITSQQYYFNRLPPLTRYSTKQNKASMEWVIGHSNLIFSLCFSFWLKLKSLSFLQPFLYPLLYVIWHQLRPYTRAKRRKKNIIPSIISHSHPPDIFSIAWVGSSTRRSAIAILENHKFSVYSLHRWEQWVEGAGWGDEEGKKSIMSSSLHRFDL